MSWKDTFEPILTRFPTVEGPEKHVPLRQKLKWTGATLLVYFFLTNILVFGMQKGGPTSDIFGQFRSVLAGSQGSILHLGIGPIVTGSIVLQLLDGGGILEFDKQDPREQVLYQGTQKVFVVLMTIITGIPMVFTGYLPVSTDIASSLGIPPIALSGIMFAQIFAGGIIILYLDEIVSKWGVGSGVGLFIIAGISQSLFGGLLTQVFAGWYGIATNGILGAGLSGQLISILFTQAYIIPILTTALIFAFVVYAESTRIEIPLERAQTKGAKAKYPLKLIYASVLPLILIRAVQANIQFIGRFLHQFMGDSLPAIIGDYSQSGQATEGIFFFLSPIQTRQEWMWFLSGTSAEPWEILIRVGVDVLFMVVGGAIFAVFWVETTGMGAKSVAEDIKKSGMQIPGFRRNPQIIERVVGRYIPAVTMLGGAIVGLLAITANMLGTIGGVSGTGLLLSVSITYRFYEEVQKELFDSPALKRLLGN
jgi:preprotein translocase subunit SecY